MNGETHKSNHFRLIRATGTVGGWTLVSRILGFVRDVLLARVLGAGLLADAFFVAFRLPNFFRRLFAEGTLTVAMVPVLQEEKKQGAEKTQQYLNAMFSCLLLALILTTVVGMIAMPLILMVFAPGFAANPDQWEQTLVLARIMFPYVLLVSLAAMFWAVLNSFQKFAISAASPAFLNVSMIIGALYLAPYFSNPALAVAVGVIMGGVLQLLILLPSLRKIGWWPRFSTHFMLAPVKKTLQLMGPAVLGVSVVQVNILIGTILATLLPVGSVSYLYFADRLVQLPLGIFGIAMGTAILPTLAAQITAHKTAEAQRTLADGLVWLLWITLPAALGLIILAEPIVRTLFEHGEFTLEASQRTALALQAFAIGLVAYCWQRILASACYARQDTKTPLRFATVALVVNVVGSIVLMPYIQHVGLALSTAIASIVNTVLLFRHLKKDTGRVFEPIHVKRIIKAVVAAVPLIGVLISGLYVWSFPDEGLSLQIFWLSFTIVGGCAVYFSMVWLLGESLLPGRANKDGNTREV